jgi:hypothetical protein
VLRRVAARPPVLVEQVLRAMLPVAASSSSRNCGAAAARRDIRRVLGLDAAVGDGSISCSDLQEGVVRSAPSAALVPIIRLRSLICDQAGADRGCRRRRR